MILYKYIFLLIFELILSACDYIMAEMTQMPLTFIFAKSFTHKLCWEILDGTDTAGMFANSGGGSIDPSRAYRCNPKSESEWAALGCMVSSGQPRAEIAAISGKLADS